jgi:threonine dehydratase
MADGLRTTLAPRTLAALRAHVETIGTCSEAGIVRAMRLTWERTKLIIEPSSAVPLACLLEGTLPVHGARVGVLLSGGNVDLDRLPWQT